MVQLLPMDDFSVGAGDFEVVRAGQFDRMWKITPGGSMCCMPLLHDNTLYFGSCNMNVYAVRITDGKLVWKYKTDGPVFESSPEYWDGSIYIGSFDQHLYRIDAATGKLIWKFPTQGRIDLTPKAWEGNVYFASSDHFIYCIDAKTGGLVWRYETQGEIVASPEVVDGKLFIGSFDYNMYCIDANTGKLIWKFLTYGEVHTMNRPLVNDGTVYFGSLDNNLYAVGIKSGMMKWKFHTGNYGNAMGPILHNGLIYHSSRDGNIFCLTADGKLVWKYTNREHMAIPIIYDNLIFAGSEDNCMHCISLEGKDLWKYGTQGPTFIRPAAKDGTIFFPSWDCHMYAIDINTRQLKWKFRTEGSPSNLPPANEAFELRVRVNTETMIEEPRRRYEISLNETEESGRFYKSSITYRMSSNYQAKGKYQSDEDDPLQ